jgi:hypothetical protein
VLVRYHDILGSEIAVLPLSRDALVLIEVSARETQGIDRREFVNNGPKDGIGNAMTLRNIRHAFFYLKPERGKELLFYFNADSMNIQIYRIIVGGDAFSVFNVIGRGILVIEVKIRIIQPDFGGLEQLITDVDDIG